MKQIFMQGGKIHLKELTPPPLDARGILVASSAVAISPGTELQGLQGTSRDPFKLIQSSKMRGLAIQKLADGTFWSLFKREFLKTTPTAPPRNHYGNPSGYSCAGRVIEVGANVIGVQPGDRVACAGSPHAEITYVPKNLFVPIPDNVSDVEASFVAIGSIALHAVRQAQLTFGETVVVMGLGLIGQLVEQIARASGAKTIVLDTIPNRVDLSKQLGAHLALNPGKDSIQSKVLEFTENIGADAVFLCMGGDSPEPIKQALNMTRERGRLVVVGTPRMDIPRVPFYQKEIELRIARSYGPGRYDVEYEQMGHDYPIGYVRWTERRNMAEFLRLVSEKHVDILSLITHIFPFEQAAEAYGIALTDKSALGIALTVSEQSQPKKTVIQADEPVLKLGVAVIGAGSFTRAFHLPNIRLVRGLELRTVVAHRHRSAQKAAAEFGAAKASADFTETLRDSTVNLVLISTPHHLHYSQTVAALEAGKAVFCEKPMGMNEDEVDQIVELVNRTKGFFAIGFNRRFSPTILRAKELLSGRKGPLVLNYRVMGTYLPADHWVYDPIQGGGRIIGEACHFFDLLCHIVDSDPVKLTAVGGTLSHPGTNLDDNLICTLSFADGSIASLVYGDLGTSQFPKEYLEVFSGDGVLAIHDFRELTVSGYSGQRGMMLPAIDKGHLAELQAVAHSLQQGLPSPVDALAGERAMKCCFAAIRALKSGEIQHIKVDV